MLAVRPPLLALDGLDPEAAYQKAREEFPRVLLAQPVRDPMGRRVLFTFGTRGGPEAAAYCQPLDPPKYDAAGRIMDDCWHVCFKQAEGVHDPYNKLPRDRFVFERAARIPWILPTLTDTHTRVHESPEKKDPERDSYTLWIPGDSRSGIAPEFFAVLVRRLPSPEEVAFITAYRLEKQQDVEKLRKRGPQVYPVKTKVKAGKKK